MPRRLALFLGLAALFAPGCGRVHFTGAEVHPVIDTQAQSYPEESHRRIREDRERLADGEPLRHHDSEADLRRHEYERDFYEDFYESQREASQPRPTPPPPPAHDRDEPGDGFGAW